MCCGRRRQQPLTVTLGIAAYEAYQRHQAKRANEQKALAPAPATHYKPEQTLDIAMRSLNLEKYDAPPPDYDDVVVHRTMVDASGRDLVVDDRDVGREKEDYLLDLKDSTHELGAEQRVLQPDAAPTWVKVSGDWREMKAAWKAEKRRAREARKAERRSRKAERKAGRCGARTC